MIIITLLVLPDVRTTVSKRETAGYMDGQRRCCVLARDVDDDTEEEYLMTVRVRHQAKLFAKPQ